MVIVLAPRAGGFKLLLHSCSPAYQGRAFGYACNYVQHHPTVCFVRLVRSDAEVGALFGLITDLLVNNESNQKQLVRFVASSALRPTLMIADVCLGLALGGLQFDMGAIAVKSMILSHVPPRMRTSRVLEGACLTRDLFRLLQHVG